MDSRAKKLPPGEIGEILSHIRANLAFHPLLPASESRREDRVKSLPPLSSWEKRVQSLRRLGAPYFVPEGRGLAAWSRRVLNLPLRLFGHKQAQFNDQSIALLAEMIQELHRTVTRQNQMLGALADEVDELRARQPGPGKGSGSDAA